MLQKTLVQIMVISAIISTAATCLAEDEDAQSRGRTRNVAIVVHESVELLDFAGPGEVFESAADRGGDSETKWFNVYTVAPSAGPIVSQGFLTITPQYTIADCPKPDIVVIPGGATGILRRDEAFMSWIERVVPGCDVSMSVCTGAFVLADLGALDGKRATTHHSSLRALKRYDSIEVVEDVRFVDNGTVVTTAGVSAGIDGALHVVARLLGRAAAEETARYMQYEWNPRPEDVAAYQWLNPKLDEVGRALQQAALYRTSGETAKALAAYESLTNDHPDEAEAWYYLGLMLHLDGRLEEAITAHRRAGASDHPQFKLNGLYNLACANALLGRTDEAVKALQAAADAGYAGLRWTQDDHDLDSIREDDGYRRAMARIAVNAARQQLQWNNDPVALDMLEDAARFGFDDWQMIAEDPAFARLRQADRFRELTSRRN